MNARNLVIGLAVLVLGAFLCAFGLPVLVFAGTTAQAATTSAASQQLDVSALPSAAQQWAPWIIQSAAQCGQLLSAPEVAAQIDQESGWNPNAVAHNPATSGGDAMGLAQFQAGTWQTWGGDADGNATNSPYDPPDAIMALGKFMCWLINWATNGVNVGTLKGDPYAIALAAYECGTGCVSDAGGVPATGIAHDYPTAVESKIDRYTLGTFASLIPNFDAQGVPSGFALPANTPSAIVSAIAWGFLQLGTPYHLDGSCTDAHSGIPAKECDCSSLMQQSYRNGGVSLPRTAAEQSRVGVKITNPAALQPGDLVFTAGSDGTRANPGHVGMYIGMGYILEAPRTGLDIRIVKFDGYWSKNWVVMRREVAW